MAKVSRCRLRLSQGREASAALASGSVIPSMSRKRNSMKDGQWDNSNGYKMAQWKGDAVLGVGVRTRVSDLHPDLSLSQMAITNMLDLTNDGFQTSHSSFEESNSQAVARSCQEGSVRKSLAPTLLDGSSAHEIH